MKKSMKFAGLVTTALVAPALFASAASAQTAASVTSRISAIQTNATARAATTPRDRVKAWNEVMLEANLIDHSTGAGQLGPTRTSRAMAMTSIAVFDAVNAFDNRFKSYNSIPAALNGASKNAAIATAAYLVLRALHPAQAVRLDGIYSSDISSLNRESASSVAAGVAVGRASAEAMLARRSNDRSSDPEPLFGAGGVLARGATLTVLGQPVNGGQLNAPNWSPDPIAQQPTSLGARWGNVTPFVLRTGDQFRIAALPQPNTARYRAGFQEVATRGADIAIPGSTNTAEDRFLGNFWGYDGQPILGTPPRLYNQVAIAIAEQQGMGLNALVRMLALVNSSMGDSGIAAWDSKYFYNYWRPSTGVRRAAEDGDATTVAVPNWRAFGISILNNLAFAGRPREQQTITPNFPAYPSGHATFGAALFESLRVFFPNNTRFTFVSDESNGTGTEVKSGEPARPFVPVRFRSFQEAQEGNGDSRIANGVHWEWDDTEGQSLGINVARFTAANAFQRR